MATPETRRQLLVAVAACDDKKGEDTRILELDPADSGLADFFLITSASNDRQVVAIADEIEFRLKKDFGLYAASVEGRRQAEWILLDYVDIVIHVFLAEKRAFYNIERLRKSARNLSATEVESELKSVLAKKTLAVRKSAPAVKATGKSPAVTPKKSAKGEPNVTAKPAKKAAKKAAVKTAKKAVKAKTTASKPALKKAVAKKAAVKKAAPKAVGVEAPSIAEGRHSTGGFGVEAPGIPEGRVSSGGFGVSALKDGVEAPVGVKAPIDKAEAPVSLAASAAPKAAKKAAKKAPAKAVKKAPAKKAAKKGKK
jgi:ribosome-associated protein